MLTKIDENGSRYLVNTVPRMDNYSKWKNLFSDSEFNNILMYVSDEIKNFNNFSVVTVFGAKSWTGTPLDLLYNRVGQNKENAAMFLGFIVIDALISTSEEDWFCIKTTLNNRDLATNFYWKSK